MNWERTKRSDGGIEYSWQTQYGTFYIVKKSSTNWRLESPTLNAPVRCNTLTDAKKRAEKEYNKRLPIEEIDLNQQVVDLRVEDNGRAYYKLQDGCIVSFPTERTPDKFRELREAEKCDCCDKYDWQIEYESDWRRRPKMETMLYDERWCHECRQQMKSGPKLKKKPDKTLAAHNKNYKNFVNGTCYPEIKWYIERVDGTHERSKEYHSVSGKEIA